MSHVDKVLNLRPDVSFNSKVCGAEWDAGTAQWHVKTENGKQARARFLILATGLLHRTYEPDFPGLGGYKGVLHHSGAWPEDTSVKGKRVAVIGAGATSVQIVQELGKEAEHLTVLMRRPSYCLPMGQRTWTEEEQRAWRAYYPALFEAGRKSQAGFPAQRPQKGVFDVSDEERERHMEETWKLGGFQFVMQGYNDVVLNKEANKVVYDYWKR